MFSADVGDQQGLVVVSEVPSAAPEVRRQSSDLDALAREVGHVVVGEHGVSPRVIVLVERGRLSGAGTRARRRRWCRAQFDEGTLEALHVWTPALSPPANGAA